jgi:hypothetical protein
MFIDPETDAALLEAAQLPDYRTLPYPKVCFLCGLTMESADDCCFWHGCGNCVEITDEMWARWEAEATLG